MAPACTCPFLTAPLPACPRLLPLRLSVPACSCLLPVSDYTCACHCLLTPAPVPSVPFPLVLVCACPCLLTPAPADMCYRHLFPPADAPPRQPVQLLETLCALRTPRVRFLYRMGLARSARAHQTPFCARELLKTGAVSENAPGAHRDVPRDGECSTDGRRMMTVISSSESPSFRKADSPF